MKIKEYIDEAIRTKKTVTIKYIKYGGEYSERRISNIEYSDEFGDEYIQAFCHTRNENRTFKISRIVSIDGVTDIVTCKMNSSTKTAYNGNTAASSTPTTQRIPNKPIKPDNNIHPNSTVEDAKLNVTKPINTFNKVPTLNIPKEHKSTSSTNYYPQQSTKKEGCYIATMVYGDYNHPKVMVLRRYRDNILLKSFLGRIGVNIYYRISPKLVKILLNHRIINYYIRKKLDRITDSITERGI